MLVESWHTKREDQIPRQLLHYIIVEGDKQHGSEELSRAEEAETSDPTSASITTTTSTSIDTNTATSIDDIWYFRHLIWCCIGWAMAGTQEAEKSAIWCMTSRHTRKNAQGELVTFSNQELASYRKTTKGTSSAWSKLWPGRLRTKTSDNQSNQQAVPATGNNQPDELKGLGMMMQQLLQGQQFQAKALNEVTNEIDTRMGNMFTELNAKYDTVASHIRKIDVQITQTAESVKRKQGTLAGKTDKNPRTEHC
ncbi:hypothetical protein DY000_02048111 [Brassica cretica]|nr:hypothetical protein DY000_02048111 [Brassica cretica]